MFITSRRVGSIFLGLLLLAGNSWAQGTSTFEGVVKDAKGQPIKGAEVRVETRGARVICKSQTDARGHYATKPVPVGVYKIDIVVNSITRGTLADAKTNNSGATKLSFAIKDASKKKLVWVQETGSRMGRWVEVDDPNASAGNSNLTRGSASSVRRMQEGSGQAQPPGN
jgi:hypothetical protein